jgi:hypothetical protein
METAVRVSVAGERAGPTRGPGGAARADDACEADAGADVVAEADSIGEVDGVGSTPAGERRPTGGVWCRAGPTISGGTATVTTAKATARPSQNAR